MAKKLKLDDWVCHTQSGRIGRIDVIGSRAAVVQFGSGGPFELINLRDLKIATSESVDFIMGVSRG